MKAFRGAAFLPILLGLLSLAASPGTAVVPVSVLPATLQEGEPAVSTFTFIVPASGMAAGGKVIIRLPEGWWPSPQTANPGMDGYVSTTTLSQGNISLFVSWQSTLTLVTAMLNSGSLVSGSTIQLSFLNFRGCPPYTSIGSNVPAQWQVSNSTAAGVAPALLAMQPSQTMLPGVGKQLSFDNWDTVRAVAGLPSAPISMSARDECWRPAPIAGPVQVSLSAQRWNSSTGLYQPDGTAQFSQTTNFGSPVTQFTMPAGASTTTFYYRSTQIGDGQIGVATNLLWGATNFLPVKVLTAFTFSGVGVDGGVPQTPPATTLNLSPDGDGSSDMAYIRFIPSDTTLPWRVTISSDGFHTLVYDYSGFGNPLSQVLWDGHLRTGWQDMGVVPNGDYYVKIESPGLGQAPLLLIRVQTASISGHVLLGGAGVAGVWVNAQSNNAGGFSMGVTDASGLFVLNGLRSGAYYNLYGSITSTSSVTSIQVQKNNVLAGTTADLTAAQPGILRIHAVLPSSSPVSLYGNLNIHPADWSRNYWGMVQFNAGENESNNGDAIQPSSWTLVGVDPNAYTVRLEIPGYGAEETSASVAAGQTTDVVVTLHPRVNITGRIVLPSTVSYGTWISVDGMPSGQTYSTIWGGANIDVGKSSATYWIYNVSSGSYRLVARAPGFVPSGRNVTVGVTDATGQDFTGFSTGGKISGSMTIQGDTSARASPLSIWLNAWSPALQVNANTSVLLPTSVSMSSTSFVMSGLADGSYEMYPPWLDGFEAEPPGMRRVTVANGTGAVSFTLKQLSGQIYGTISLPSSPPPDYSQVQLILSGPSGMNQNASAASYSIDHLASGYYTLVAIYRLTGAQVRQTVPVVNGQSRRLDLDLSAPAHAVSGRVSLSGSLSMKDPNGNPVTVNLLSDLTANATQQTVYEDGMTSQGWLGETYCSGGTPVTAPTARVEAFPKDLGSYGSSSRSGLNNCFGPGQFKYGVFDDSGSYSISGLSPGVWEISVYPFFDNGTIPNISWTKQVVTITDQDIANVDFTLAKGYSASGTISLPSGMTDYRTLQARVVTARGDWIQSSEFYLGGAGSGTTSVNYRFDSLPLGDLVLVVQDVTGMGGGAANAGSGNGMCSTKTLPFTVKGADISGLNVTLSRAARIVGKIAVAGKNPDGSAALTLITSNNSDLLPQNYQISAQANPWVEGGWQQANNDGMSGRPAIDANGQFVIDGLASGNYDVHFRPDIGGGSNSGVSLAALTKAQIHVEEGQVVDIGTVKLVPGLSLSGSVTDASGVALPNIRIEAWPSSASGGEDSLSTLSDGEGQFTLSGLDPGVRFYHVVAARRPRSTEKDIQSVPYGEVTTLAVDVTKIPAPSLNFVLPAAHAILTGRIVTVDSGALGYPEDQMQGYPAAAVYLHRQGNISAEDNPLGEYTEMTGLDGRFRILNLVGGTYEVTLMSLNYRPVRMTVQLTDSQPLDLGTVTLQKGPTLVATVKTPSGGAVTTNDVSFAVAATPDLSNLIFGQIISDANTKNILSIRFSGFELSPKVYSIILANKTDNMTMPPEGKRVIFTEDDDSGALALTYQPGQPSAFAHLTKRGLDMDVKFYFTGSLRNLSSDQDPTQWIQVLSGQGTLSQHAVTDDRSRFSVTYTPFPGEQTATLRLSVYSAQVNPATNANFLITKDVILRFGQKAHVQKNISAILGGDLDLSDSDDPSHVNVPQNALLATDGLDQDATVSYSIEFAATDDQTTLAAASPSARMAAMSARGPMAYFSEAWAALGSARTSAAINPLSSFYSVLLPAGLSHTLNETAYLTLSYDTNADPALINVYYFDGTRYILENNQRSVDLVNHTITVGVSHFSTFVVLENSATVVLVDGGASTAGDIDVINFPNPFDLQSKSKALAHNDGTTTSLDTDGTIIRYTIPADKAGAAQITIYNVVGEKVRSLDLGSPAADTFHYVPWDGKNDSGHRLASGVYIGVLKVGGSKKYWKMAVIK